MGNRLRDVSGPPRSDLADCAHTDVLRALLIEVEPRVVRSGVEAMAKGPDWGVLVALTDELGAQNPEEEAEIAASADSGIYVGALPIENLVLFAKSTGSSPELEGLIAQLLGPAPSGQVHVLAVIDKTAVTVTARASAAMVAARERDAERIKKIHQMLQQAEPDVLRLAAEGARRVLVVLPDDPILKRLGQIEIETALSKGLYVGAHSGADLIRALRLEDLREEDAGRAARRLMHLPPPGRVDVIALFDGHMTRVTVDPRPGCLDREL